MGIDVVKTWFTYLIAGFVVVGGFVFLYLTRADPGSRDTQLLVGGFIGAAIQFAFNQQIQSATAHQTSVAANTLASAATPNTLVTTPGPVSVAGPTVVTPSEPKPED